MDTEVKILVATGAGLWRVAGSGIEPVEALAGREVTALARDGRRTWAILDGRALWSEDDGGPWQEATPPLDGPAVTCVAATPRGALLGTEDARLWWLVDGAFSRIESFDTVQGRESWYTPWGDPPAVRSMAVATDGTIHVNVHVGGVPRSRDGGQTWTPTVEVEADVHQVLAHPVQLDVVLGAAYEGFGISRDGGDSWTFLTDGMHAHYARAVAVADDIVLVSASTGPGGRRSTLYRKPLDEARAFERCADLPWFQDNIDTGCLHAAGPVVVFGTADGRLFRSPDHGQSWSLVAQGLPLVTAVLLVTS